MTEKGIVSIFVNSRGFQYVLIAIAIVIGIKLLRREITDTTKAVSSGVSNTANKLVNSELGQLGTNVIRSANQVVGQNPRLLASSIVGISPFLGENSDQFTEYQEVLDNMHIEQKRRALKAKS